MRDKHAKSGGVDTLSTSTFVIIQSKGTCNFLKE